MNMIILFLLVMFLLGLQEAWDKTQEKYKYWTPGPD